MYGPGKKAKLLLLILDTSMNKAFNEHRLLNPDHTINNDRLSGLTELEEMEVVTSFTVQYSICTNDENSCSTLVKKELVKRFFKPLKNKTYDRLNYEYWCDVFNYNTDDDF